MQRKKVKGLPPAAFKFYLGHAVEFVEQQVLCLTPEEVKANEVGKRLEPETKSILYNVGKHDYVSVFSGRGCTKTASLAFLALWWLFTRNDARVMATGPKFDQLKITLWAEIQKWLSRSYLTDEIKWSSERLYHVDPKMGSFGQIITSKEKENVAGVHATHVLWLIDEASNVEQAMIDAILGGMTDPESKCVMTGNPTKASGAFFDTHNKDRDQWKCLQFSSENSARKNPVWFKKMQRHPRESDMYRVYVLGMPPLGNPKAIITLADCYEACDRTLGTGSYLEMGVDPAREGNDLTAISIRQGLKLLEIRTFSKTKGPEVILQTLKMLREYRKKTGIKSKVKIKIDDHGMGGPIGDELALNTTDNIEVVPCLFGGKGDDRYSDPATIMWFNMADVIGEVELPRDEELLEELSTREWVPASGNRMQVEAKAKYKERLGRSPDRADSCILCYYSGQKKIFSREDNSEPNVKDFEIDWQNQKITNPSFDGVLMIDVLHYAALVLNEDLSFTGIAAIYQQFLDQLWIYEEFYQEQPEPDLISKIVRFKTKHQLKFEDERNVRVVGNERMFRQEGDRRPLSDILLREGLVVSPPVRYDEYGAIALGTKMYREDRITMHSRLRQSRSQINLWALKKGKPETEEYCKALLLILSEVRRQKKDKPPEKKFNDYKPKKAPYKPKGRMTAWLSR